MNLLSELRGLPRELWMLYAATVISRTGTMALFFLAVYLSSLGVSETRGGLAVSIYGLGALIAAPAAGYFCDRLNPLVIMKAALFTQGLILLLFPAARSFESFLAITLAWALAGEAFRPASSVFIGRVTVREQRQVSFALNSVAINLGTAVGPVLGGLLLQTRPTYIFVANGAASLAAGAFLTVSLRGGKFGGVLAPAEREGGREEGEGLAALGVRRLLMFLLALIPAFAVFYQYRSTMSQYFLDRRILEPHVYGFLLPINALLVITAQVPLAARLRRGHEKLGMAMGAFLVGTGFGCFAFAGGVAGAAACVVIWTFGQMTMISSSDSYVSKITGRRKGLYTGLYHMAVNFAAAAGPVLGSALLEYSPPTLWAAAFVWGCFSAVMLLRVPKCLRVTSP